MTLGLVSDRVDTDMYTTDTYRSVPNPLFRETHLSNPLKCPACGRTFYAFVGVSYDFNRHSVRGVDVKVVREDEDSVEQLLNWPHKGLVMSEVLEYTPFEVKVYNDLNHFEEYNRESRKDIVVSSLMSSTKPRSLGGGSGNSGEPVVVKLKG